jgi:hypothetical protein
MLEYSYSSDPTPHIYLPQLLPPEIYRKINFFPDIKVQKEGAGEICLWASLGTMKL